MQLQNRTYTREEYLQLEEQAEYRSEYLDGKIVQIDRRDNESQWNQLKSSY